MALFQDLLIGVTGFFREGPAFESLERKIPALLLSGDTQVASVREMQASGHGVLQKPVEVEQLVAQLNRLLEE
jgi:FixJ family two-component response regulator